MNNFIIILFGLLFVEQMKKKQLIGNSFQEDQNGIGGNYNIHAIDNDQNKLCADIVIVHIGVEFRGTTTFCTRTLMFQPDESTKALYQTIVNVHAFMMSMLKPKIQLEQHSEHDLSLCCLEKACSDKLLICPMCEHQKHENHATIPLKIMLNSLTHAREANINLTEVSQAIERSHTQCQQQLYKFHEMIRNTYVQMSRKIDSYYLYLKDQIQTHVATMRRGSFTDALICAQNISSQQECLNEILRSYTFVNGEAIKLNVYSTTISLCQQQVNSLQEKIAELQAEFEKKIDHVSLQFKQVEFQPTIVNTDYLFSNTLKGAHILVNSSSTIAEQKSSESNGQRFIICEPIIPKGAITKFGFKIIKYTGWIGIGVCHKDVLIAAGYKFNYTNIGHGSYLVSNNAYSWSHLQKDLNSTHKSFDFAVNDIIVVEVDMPKKKITWYKKKTQLKFTMDLDTNLDLYPCANLCSPGDTVEIINKID